jgi:hypothetical protein
MLAYADTQAKAAMLISELLCQIPDRESRQSEAERAIQCATPVSFAMECIRWINHYDDKPEEKRVLTEEGYEIIKGILISRIEEADDSSPIFISQPKDASLLYFYWVDGTSVTHVQQKLIAHFNNLPEQLDIFLACYVGESWGLESGLPMPSRFRRDQYDSVCAILPAEYIAGNLRLRYGEEFNGRQHLSENSQEEYRIANEFMLVHQRVLSEQQEVVKDD